MTNAQPVKAPVWFWIIAVLAVVWNAMGVFAYISDATMSAETLAKYPPAEQTLIEARPSWIFGVYAIAVFAGLVGAIFLLAKKSWAVPLFVVSLAAVVVQMSYIVFGMNLVGALGLSAALMPTVILIIAAFLVWWSLYANARAWLK